MMIRIDEDCNLGLLQIDGFLIKLTACANGDTPFTFTLRGKDTHISPLTTVLESLPDCLDWLGSEEIAGCSRKKTRSPMRSCDSVRLFRFVMTHGKSRFFSDPSGNSFIENPMAPATDPALTAVS